MDEDVQVILERARGRARVKGLAYAGEVTPEEAQVLARAGRARIIDVRTRFEAEYVGRISGVPLIEWKALGASTSSPDFLSSLEAVAGKDEHLIFLCRSGVRSHAASLAAAGAGYESAFNMIEGFEGDLDQHQHRGASGGWRYRGLPWIQS